MLTGAACNLRGGCVDGIMIPHEIQDRHIGDRDRSLPGGAGAPEGELDPLLVGLLGRGRCVAVRPAFRAPSGNAGGAVRVSGRLALLALLATTGGKSAAEDSPPSYGLDWPKIRFAADRFQLRVPPEWVAIPEMHLDGMLAGATARRIAQDARAEPIYRFGFQESPIGEWFHGAYFLIDVQMMRRPTRQELLALPTVESALPDGMPMRPDGSRGVFSRTAAGTYLYEPRCDVVWLNLGTQPPSSDGTQAVAAMCLTQKGVVQLNFYAPLGARGAYLELFERIARTVEIDPVLRYRKPMIEAWPLLSLLDWSDPTLRYVEFGTVVIFAFALGGLCRALVRRVELDEANPLNPLDEETLGSR